MEDKWLDVLIIRRDCLRVDDDFLDEALADHIENKTPIKDIDFTWLAIWFVNHLTDYRWDDLTEESLDKVAVCLRNRYAEIVKQ